MENVKFKLKSSEDPIGQKFAKFPYPQISHLIGFSLTRDRCRTPMQWSPEPHAGFSSNKEIEPWLKVSNNSNLVNVEIQKENPASLLNIYKKLLKIRKEFNSLHEGELEFIKLEDLFKKVLAYRRVYGNQEILIYLNFANKDLTFRISKSNPELIFSSYFNNKESDIFINDRYIKLSAFEAVIFK